MARALLVVDFLHQIDARAEQMQQRGSLQDSPHHIHSQTLVVTDQVKVNISAVIATDQIALVFLSHLFGKLKQD